MIASSTSGSRLPLGSLYRSMSGWTATLSLIRTRLRTASLCSRISCSFLIHVCGSLGSPTQPPPSSARASTKPMLLLQRHMTRLLRKLPDCSGVRTWREGVWLAAALGLGLDREVEVVVARDSRRVHDLLQDL